MSYVFLLFIYTLASYLVPAFGLYLFFSLFRERNQNRFQKLFAYAMALEKLK